MVTSMAENEIVVRVFNQVVGGTSIALSGVGGVGASGETIASFNSVPQIPTMNSLGMMMGTKAILSGANRLLGSFTDTSTIRSLNQIAEYAVLGARALAGDPGAMIGITIKATADIISKAKQDAVERATALNQVDDARIRSGLLDLNGARVKINWFDGRYKYSRG